MTERALDASLAAGFTPLSEDDALGLAARHWGLAALSARRLETERDDTFLLETAAGRYVLKVANPADRLDEIALQCAALEHVAESDPGLAVPRVRRSGSGPVAIVEGAQGEARAARLLSWLPGRTLDYAECDGARRRAVGALMARLSVALIGFDHPGADRVLAWDLQRLGALRGLVDHVADPRSRDDVLAELDRYDAVTAPGLRNIRHQVVHNDVNMDNVVVDGLGQASGILDFGDMVRTAVVADLAVAMAYAVPSAAALADPSTDPWADAYDVADGYRSVRALDPDELALLPSLVRARMAQRLLVNSWLASTNPGNAHHTLRANGHAAAALRRLASAPAPEGRFA